MLLLRTEELQDDVVRWAHDQARWIPRHRINADGRAHHQAARRSGAPL
jgi:hypothetical protein